MSLDRHFAIDTPQGKLFGTLFLPDFPRSLIIVPRGGDPRGPQARIADALPAHGHALLHIELLSHQEAPFGEIAQNIHLLTPKLTGVLDTLKEDGDTAGLPIGIFAVGPVAAAALRVTAMRDAEVKTLVVYQGLIDHAGKQYLEALASPLLVLLDRAAETLAPMEAATERAFHYVQATRELRLIDDGELVATSAQWFSQQLLAQGPADLRG